MGQALHRIGSWPVFAWCAVLGSAFLFVLLLNPGGFVGGGQDDWHYLQAARCIREHGLCLPDNHWESRWPVIAPIAFMTAILGESRLSISVAPVLASFAALALLALIGNRLTGRHTGWIGALLLLLTPAFATQLSRPAVEATELCFIFAGFLSVLKWQDSRSVYWAFLSGLLFSLAVQVRETALIAAAFTFVYLHARKPRPRLSDIAAAAAGCALPLLVEFAIFAVSTGDPFYRFKLSIAHTQIWSSELQGPIDQNYPPFFNKNYIANWRIEPGLHVHWAVDGLLNLFVNGLAGLSIPFVTLVVLFGRRKIGHQTWTHALVLLLVAIAYAAGLIYAFAVDPKARMMLVPVSITSLALSLIALRLVAIGYPLVAYSMLAGAAILGLTLQFSHQRTDYLEHAATQWIGTRPGQVEIDSAARKYLALVPAAQRLPGIEVDRPFLLFSSSTRCAEWIAKTGLPSKTLTIVRTQRNTRVSVAGVGGELCLFRYERPISGSVMNSIIYRLRHQERLRKREGYAGPPQ